MDKATWTDGIDPAASDASGVAVQLFEQFVSAGQQPAELWDEPSRLTRILLQRLAIGLEDWRVEAVLDALPTRDPLPRSTAVARCFEDLPEGPATFHLDAQWVDVVVDADDICWLETWLPSREGEGWREVSIRIEARPDQALAAVLAFRAARPGPLEVSQSRGLSCTLGEIAQRSGNDAQTFVSLATVALLKEPRPGPLARPDEWSRRRAHLAPAQ